MISVPFITEESELGGLDLVTYCKFWSAVELHGAGAERDHGMDEREVLVLKHLHVAHNGSLCMVAVKEQTEKQKN